MQLVMIIGGISIAISVILFYSLTRLWAAQDKFMNELHTLLCVDIVPGVSQYYTTKSERVVLCFMTYRDQVIHTGSNSIIPARKIISLFNVLQVPDRVKYIETELCNITLLTAFYELYKDLDDIIADHWYGGGINNLKGAWNRRVEDFFNEFQRRNYLTKTK